MEEGQILDVDLKPRAASLPRHKAELVIFDHRGHISYDPPNWELSSNGFLQNLVRRDEGPI